MGPVSLRRSALALVTTGLVACNLLTGVGDLGTSACPECGPGGSSGSSGTSGGPDGDTNFEGGRFDAAFDVPNVPKPGGNLDPTFGNGGKVVSALLDTVTSLAIRADGKIVVAGAFGGQLAVARFDPSGAPDLGFGGNGRVVAAALTSSRADAVAIDSVGRVLAGGHATSVGPPPTTATQLAYIVRIGETGLDTTFGSGGRKTLTVDGEAVTCILPAAGDGCFLGGRAGNVGAVWQLSSTGTVVQLGGAPRFDITYAAGALASTVTGMRGTGASLVVIGTVTPQIGDRDFAAARLIPAGFDVTFSGDGKAGFPVGPSEDTALALGTFTDGSYLLGGEVDVPGLVARSPQVGLVRMKSDGTLDATWGDEGKVIAKFEQPGQLGTNLKDFVRGVAVDKQDRAIAAGTTEEKPFSGGGPPKRRAAVLRLTKNGQSDFFFGSFGMVLFQFESTVDARVNAVALQADGSIIVAGTSGSQLGLARITP